MLRISAGTVAKKMQACWGSQGPFKVAIKLCLVGFGGGPAWLVRVLNRPLHMGKELGLLVVEDEEGIWEVGFPSICWVYVWAT